MRNDYAEAQTHSLVGADYNPNTLTDAEFTALVAEVRAKGRLMKPIVVREHEGARIIVDGHFNWQAARVAGLATVPIEVIEADEFEARRQTLIRNRTGRKDNLLLGRVYREMRAARNLSNRELAETLGVSEGSLRNQMLYPDAWDLLREKGNRLVNDAGQPITPEAYSGWNGVYTETIVSKLSVRDVRALVAGLRGLTDEEGDQPGGAMPEARILARLKRAWANATEDERREFIEWTGAVDAAAKAGFAQGYRQGHADADLRSRYSPEREELGEELAAEVNGEARSYAADDPIELGRRVRAARKARGWSQGALADAAGTHPPIISQIERGVVGKVGKATLQRVVETVLL